MNSERLVIEAINDGVCMVSERESEVQWIHRAEYVDDHPAGVPKGQLRERTVARVWRFWVTNREGATSWGVWIPAVSLPQPKLVDFDTATHTCTCDGQSADS